MFHRGRMSPAPYVLAATALTVAGCAAHSRSTTMAAPPQTTSTSAHLMVSDWVNGDDAMLALTYGTLATGADGCVGLQVRGARKSVLVNWPAGSELTADGLAVHGSTGTLYRMGAEVGLGGGFGLRPLPAGCDPSLWSSVFEVQQPL